MANQGQRDISIVPTFVPTQQTDGCATRNGQSCPAGLPIVVEFTAVTAATDGDDRIGAANGPEHSGAFEPGADEGFAARFDHSGTHEQSLLTDFG